MQTSIPKIFHYCWFGKKPLPKVAQMCLNSWREIHPDFEVKRWDEGNTDLSHPFVKEAYAAKKWAFVADFVRMHVLTHEGGIYLDTDMLLLKPLTDLLTLNGFIGFEDHKYVSAGIIGAVPNHPIIHQVADFYKTQQFNADNPVLVNTVLNKICQENGLKNFNVRQTLGEMDLFPANYFYAYTFAHAQTDADFASYVLPESYAVHLWDHSWGDEFSEFRKGNTLKGIQKVAAKVIKNPKQPRSYYKKVMKNVIKSSNKK